MAMWLIVVVGGALGAAFRCDLRHTALWRGLCFDAQKQMDCRENGGGFGDAAMLVKSTPQRPVR